MTDLSLSVALGAALAALLAARRLRHRVSDLELLLEAHMILTEHEHT